MRKQTRLQKLFPKPTHSLKACFRLPGDINVVVGNIPGGAMVGWPASQKDRHNRFRVDHKRRVIVEARYLSAENHMQEFWVAGDWNMTAVVVRKAGSQRSSPAGAKNTWMIANSELRQMILASAPLRPRGADDTGLEIIATFMRAGVLKNARKGLGT